MRGYQEIKREGMNRRVKKLLSVFGCLSMVFIEIISYAK